MIARKLLKATVLFFLTFIAANSYGQLRANFTANPTSGCNPLIVRFTDQSTGNPTSWKWDLGNGTISTLQNPSATYFTAGNYNVKLIVRNQNGVDSIVKSQFINVYGKPVVDFLASRTEGCFPMPVQFTDFTTSEGGTIVSWQWDFGDGTGANIQNPTHTYTRSGNFNVTLQVRNSNGCTTTLSRTSYIKITAGAKANFTSSVSNSCSLPVAVTFTNTTTGTGSLTYKWIFGDGDTSYQQQPIHAYQQSGLYTVKLIVFTANGCTDTLVKTGGVNISVIRPSFTSVDSICVGGSIAFTNRTSPNPTAVLWSFGNLGSSTQLSPTFLFTQPGVHIIKMVAALNGCKDSVTKSIRVLPKAVAAFRADDTVDCKIPFTVQFANQSVNGATYYWSFGDNQFSTLENPSHTYNSYGRFRVSLKVVSSSGCVDSVVKNSYITITKPTVQLLNLPDSGCAPLSKNFRALVSTNDSVASYLWDFGDGGSSAQFNPTYVYNNTGIYNVRLSIVTLGGCIADVVFNQGIRVGTKPVLAFNASPRSGCAEFPINFRDSTVGATAWMWNFGDGSFSSLNNPSHKYQDTGFFNVKLIVWNNGCVDSLKVDSFVHIKPPIAKFNIAFNCNDPYKRVFTDQSIGADQWFWDFGDGSTSNLKNPIHSYIRQGTFNVSLRVVNNLYGCEFSIVKQVQIVDVQTKFSASDTVPCKGRQITFTTGLVTANVVNFNWFTGDNPNPVVVSGVSSLNYTYRNTGYYTVKLITRDILGCMDTVVKTNYIRVDGPTAKFSVVQPGACLNSTVQFIDSSISDGRNTLQSWMYNYGDGNTQTLTSGAAQHAYANPGSYTVSLKLTDSKGCTDQVNLPAPFIVSKPIAKFITNDTINCPGHTITFTSQSTGPNLTYQWNFGDGGIASAVNPVHPYATAGRYDVKLVIVDRYGCTDSITKFGVVNIVLPTAGFSMSDSLGFCPPMLVQFTNQSQYMVSKVWDFGDSTFSTLNDPSHFYTKAGVYNVKLNIVGIGGCTSVLTKQIVLRGPRGSFSYNARTGCNPLSIPFIGHTEEAAKFIWDFNDGNIQETVDSNVVHVFTDPGSFLPKMILEDSTGCRVPIPGIDTILVKGVVAKFKFNDIALCDSGRVAFTDSSISNDVIRGYKWIFGDGYFDSIKNASHTYHTSGLYFPTLVVNTAAGCTDTIASSVPVRIVKSPNISIVASANGCVPLQVQLSARLNVADTSLIQWGWRFADGSISSLVQPQLQQYPNAGNFTVSLKATNSSGCATIVNHNIEAYPIPIVSVGNDQLLCKGSTMRLTASGADSYSWSPAIDLSCVNCSTTVTSTLLDMQYVVAGTTIHGCSAKDTIKINVKEKFIMKHSQGKSLCKGESHEVRASGADSYVWFPVNGLKNATDSIQDAHPGVTTTYRVIGSDNVGCFKDTGFITIVVHPIPTVEAGMNRTINVGQSIDLIPAISSDVTEVQWFPNDGLTRNMFPGITVRPNANIDYTVEVKNIGGCTARDKISVFVLCNGGNVFIPNTFSPDGNGVNDVFYPRGTGLYRIKNMKIYNRWGEVMYERSSFLANDATASWDGTFKGKKLSPDVFVYTIDIICDNNAVLNYQGNVALVR